VERKAVHTALLAMLGGELSLMGIQLKSTSVCSVMDETQ